MDVQLTDKEKTYRLTDAEVEGEPGKWVRGIRRWTDGRTSHASHSQLHVNPAGAALPQKFIS